MNLLFVFALWNAQGEPNGHASFTSTSDTVVPDKLGIEVRLTKKERSQLKHVECAMCEAVLTEMYEEVERHNMTEKGEDHVWETANAICLAVLQKYTLNLTSPTLSRKLPSGDDEHDSFVSKQDETPETAVRAMLVLKMGCQHWVEDYGGDTPGYIFKSVRQKDKSANVAANNFCTESVNLCGAQKGFRKKRIEKSERKRRKERETAIKKQEKLEIERAETDPISTLPEDSKFGLQRMLEMARDDPLHYLDSAMKSRTQQARLDLRCEVCRVAVGDVYEQVVQRPKNQQTEADILSIAERSCEGGRDLSVPSYFGVEPPPLPPMWTDRVRPYLNSKTGQYSLKPFGPKASILSRKKWRSLSKDGRQGQLSEADSEYDMMLTLTCKDILDADRIAEVLHFHMAQCETEGSLVCSPSASAANEVCKTVADVRCGLHEPSESVDQFAGDSEL